MKCIVTDLDGTLLTSNSSISKRTEQSFQYLKDNGYTIVIASGRTDYEMTELTSLLHLESYDNAYFISYNGVKTSKTSTNEVLSEVFLSKDDARDIIKMLVEANLKIHVFTKNTIFISKDMSLQLHQSENSPQIVKRVNMKHWRGTNDIYKILVYEDEKVLNDFKRHYQKDQFQDFTLFKSHPRLLEFVACHGTKGDALKRLCEQLGIGPKEVIAFGDEENDISMLQYAGIGVAMGNAKPMVKEIADIETLSNDLDGVSEIIHYYIIDKGV